MTQTLESYNTRARVNEAIRRMRNGKTDSRSFDNCFEMYDGSYVVALICRREPELVKQYFKGVDNIPWFETAKKFDGMTDTEIYNAARLHIDKCHAMNN